MRHRIKQANVEVSLFSVGERQFVAAMLGDGDMPTVFPASVWFSLYEIDETKPKTASIEARLVQAALRPKPEKPARKLLEVTREQVLAALPFPRTTSELAAAIFPGQRGMFTAVRETCMSLADEGSIKKIIDEGGIEKWQKA